MSAACTRITDIPHEVLLLVLGLLGARDLAQCRRVSRDWRCLASDALLWRRLLLVDFLVDVSATSSAHAHVSLADTHAHNSGATNSSSRQLEATSVCWADSLCNAHSPPAHTVSLVDNLPSLRFIPCNAVDSEQRSRSEPSSHELYVRKFRTDSIWRSLRPMRAAALLPDILDRLTAAACLPRTVLLTHLSVTSLFFVFVLLPPRASHFRTPHVVLLRRSALSERWMRGDRSASVADDQFRAVTALPYVHGEATTLAVCDDVGVLCIRHCLHVFALASASRLYTVALDSAASGRAFACCALDTHLDLMLALDDRQTLFAWSLTTGRRRFVRTDIVSVASSLRRSLAIVRRAGMIVCCGGNGQAVVLSALDGSTVSQLPCPIMGGMTSPCVASDSRSSALLGMPPFVACWNVVAPPVAFHDVALLNVTSTVLHMHWHENRIYIVMPSHVQVWDAKVLLQGDASTGAVSWRRSVPTGRPLATYALSSRPLTDASIHGEDDILWVCGEGQLLLAMTKAPC